MQGLAMVTQAFAVVAGDDDGGGAAAGFDARLKCFDKTTRNRRTSWMITTSESPPLRSRPEVLL